MWQRVVDPYDRRRTVYWLNQLGNGPDWFGISRDHVDGKYLWVWHTGLGDVVAYGKRHSLASAQRAAEAAFRRERLWD